MIGLKGQFQGDVSGIMGLKSGISDIAFSSSLHYWYFKYHKKESGVALLLKILFLPGTLVLRFLGVSVEEDSGIVRSFINSSFWGAIALAIALHYLT